jgi:hypothetical protein
VRLPKGPKDIPIVLIIMTDRYDGMSREDLIEKLEKIRLERVRIRKNNYEKNKGKPKDKKELTKDKPYWKCDLCNVELACAVSKKDHLKSKKHLNGGVSPVRVRRKKEQKPEAIGGLVDAVGIATELQKVINEPISTDTEKSSDIL